jgi:hypothetical protein
MSGCWGGACDVAARPVAQGRSVSRAEAARSRMAVHSACVEGRAISRKHDLNHAVDDLLLVGDAVIERECVTSKQAAFGARSPPPSDCPASARHSRPRGARAPTLSAPTPRPLVPPRMQGRPSRSPRTTHRNEAQSMTKPARRELLSQCRRLHVLLRTVGHALALREGPKPHADGTGPPIASGAMSWHLASTQTPAPAIRRSGLVAVRLSLLA